jgi:hypothetical protein
MAEIEPTVIEMRQQEVDSYTKNIENYTSMLNGMNGEWDADLIHLKEIGGHEAAKLCPLDRIERLSELLFHDQLQDLVRTEMLERYKAQSILNSLKLQ